MNRIFDITLKDLTQILRDRKTFLFLLIMPIAFTILFGLAFGGSGKPQPITRLPVGYLDQDQRRPQSPLMNTVWLDPPSSAWMKLRPAAKQISKQLVGAIKNWQPP